MKKAVFVLAFLVSGAVYAGQPQDSGVCSREKEKFCADVKPGQGRILACLNEHKKELSKDCAQRVEKASSARERKKNKSGQACFALYRQGFKDGFKAGFGPKAFKKTMAKNEKTGVCRDDASKFCANVKPGDGRIKKCLAENISKLSASCKARMDKFAAAR